MNLKHSVRLFRPGFTFTHIITIAAVAALSAGSAGAEVRLGDYSSESLPGTVLEFAIVDSGGRVLGSVHESFSDGRMDGESRLQLRSSQEHSATFSYLSHIDQSGQLVLDHYTAETTHNGSTIASVAVAFETPTESFSAVTVGEVRRYSAGFTEVVESADGSQRERRGTKHMTWMLEGFEDVNVPAGIFPAARIRVNTRLVYEDDPENELSVAETTWRVEGLGLVRRAFHSAPAGAPAVQQLTAYSGPSRDETSGEPEAPADLTAALDSSDRVRLSWQAPGGETSVTGYRIERHAGDGNFIVLVTDTGTTATEFVDTGVQPGTTYTYRIRAINEQGLSDTSESVTVSLPPADSSSGIRTADGLVALYFMNEGSGNRVYDYSGVEPAINLERDGGVFWYRDGGVAFDGTGTLASAGPADKLHDRLTASGAFTFEIWAEPSSFNQDGPARILTYSNGISQRNFTLGQASGADLVTRLRTTDEGDNNGIPDSVSRDMLHYEPSHYVVTYDGAHLAFYRDGVLYHEEARAGALSNWDRDFPLALGNEIGGDRGWMGSLYLAAIYDRALTPAEIDANYLATAHPPSEGILVSQDIGERSAPGSSRFDPLTAQFTLSASGGDIRGRRDGFHFLHLPMEGDGHVVALLRGIDSDDEFAKAGIMIRESLDPDARYAMIAGTPGHSASLLRRTETGGFSYDTTDWGAPHPLWVALQRSGDEIRTYYSRNGTSWRQFDTLHLDLAESTYIGLAVSSSGNAGTATATFESVIFSNLSEETLRIVNREQDPAGEPIEDSAGSGEPASTVAFASTGGSLDPVESGRFSLHLNRSGDEAEALSVHYKLSGPGAELIDRDRTPSPLNIDAGRDSGTLTFSLKEKVFVPEDMLLTLDLVDDGAYNLGTPKQIAFTIKAPPGDRWKADHFTASELADPAISGDTAAPAGDGVPNLLKYALGEDPWKPMPADRRPSLGTSRGHLELRFDRPAGRSDLRYIVEASSDLSTWTSGSDHVDVEVTTLIEGERVTGRDRFPLGSFEQRFLRLRVERR